MKWIKNSRGLSLAELLATVVLVSIILMLVFSIVVSSQSQSIEQTKEVQQINDASYVLKVLTRDFRKTTDVQINNDYYTLTLYEETMPVTYEFKNNELYRNNLILVNNIYGFSLKNDVTTIEIKFSMNGQNYHTSLSFRRGSTQ